MNVTTYSGGSRPVRLSLPCAGGSFGAGRFNPVPKSAWFLRTFAFFCGSISSFHLCHSLTEINHQSSKILCSLATSITRSYAKLRDITFKAVKIKTRQDMSRTFLNLFYTYCLTPFNANLRELTFNRASIIKNLWTMDRGLGTVDRLSTSQKPAPALSPPGNGSCHSRWLNARRSRIVFPSKIHAAPRSAPSAPVMWDRITKSSTHPAPRQNAADRYHPR